jgi:hypothetical protein
MINPQMLILPSSRRGNLLYCEEAHLLSSFFCAHSSPFPAITAPSQLRLSLSYLCVARKGVLLQSNEGGTLS